MVISIPRKAQTPSKNRQSTRTITDADEMCFVNVFQLNNWIGMLMSLCRVLLIMLRVHINIKGIVNWMIMLNDHTFTSKWWNELYLTLILDRMTLDGSLLPNNLHVQALSWYPHWSYSNRMISSSHLEMIRSSNLKLNQNNAQYERHSL